eukprot:TRINITY_DN10289_c0_g2_i2.p1 TRINITY_DN10289_c0_g2~~TRINITY_DN10289_c0_g2_i2.p1  ORF type:complete len:571 (+),score=164.58 TRINITY_DN10289_c0_g2_i2:73-1785(+)
MPRGYERVSGDDDSDNGAPLVTDADKAKLASLRGIFAIIGLLGCMAGQIIVWSVADDLKKVWGNNPVAINQAGTYLIFLVILCGLNVYTFLRGRHDLLWCTAVFLFEVFDRVVQDARLVSDVGAGKLLVAYMLAIAGTILTFVVYPFGTDTLAQLRADLKEAGCSRILVALIVLVLTVVGSIIVWADEPRDKAHISAALVGLFYFFSVVTNSVPGQELCFIYMSITVVKYEPFSSTGAAVLGNGLAYGGLLLACVYHLIIDCLGTSRSQWSPGFVEKGKLGLQGICFVLATGGGLAVMVAKRGDVHPSALECWVVITMIVATFFMVLVEKSRNAGVAVFAMSLMISVMNPALGYINDLNIEGGEALGASTVTRVGYILLFLGSCLSFLGLPVRWNGNVSAAHAKELLGNAETKPYVYSALAIFCCVLFLWSEGQFEGALGFYSIAMMICATQGFPEGLQWCYVVSLLFLPRLTPFTASFAGTRTPATGVAKVAFLVCFFALLNTIHTHVMRFGVCAFEELRLFSRRADGGDGVDDAADDAERPADAPQPPALVPPPAAPTEGDAPTEVVM